MLSFENIHTNHIVLGGYLLAHVLFLVISKDYIQKALTEKALPSSFRLIGFMFANAIIFAFCYSTVRQDKLDTTQLLYMLLGMGACLGIIKMAQILELRNGRAQTTTSSETKSSETTTQTTQKEVDHKES